MAKVFLSYERDDAERAKTIARALERGGYAVWWDRHITGGAEFAQQIEQELAKSVAVVVLWSERSIHSAWVRDEAAEGRDKGKLIPVSLDGTPAPMGFRQYQSIDLSAARSERGSEMRRLLDAIGGLAAILAADDNAKLGEAPQRRVRKGAPSNWRVYAATAAIVAALASGGFWLLHRDSDTTSLTIAASDASPDSTALARDLLVKLSSLQGHNDGQFRIVTGENAKGADLLFKTALRREADANLATLALVSQRDDEILWSGELKSSTGQAADLEQQVAYSAARILDCAQHALAPGAKLRSQTVKTYLDGCARISELIGADPRQVRPLFEQVTRDAPGFKAGWAKLLLIDASSALPEELDLTNGQHARTRDTIARARALDPAMPEVALAEVELLPMDALQQRFRLLDQAVARHPDDPNLLITRASQLAAIGRWNEAIADSRAAKDADPLNPAFENEYILNLAFSGQAPTAFKELDQADKLWPGASNLRTTRFWLNFRFGDPRIALDLLRQGAARLPNEVQLVALARIDPGNGNMERARTFIRKALVTNTSAGPIQGSAALGIEQELWPLLLARRRLETSVLSVMMQPAFRAFRRDPRFIALAGRTNILAYWRSSGNWPDFCNEPDLPYDCKAEAAKLGA